MSFDSVRRADRMHAIRGSKLLTMGEIERVYGVHRTIVQEHVERGDLKPIRVGKRIRFSEAEWLRFLADGGSRTA
jgi:excisionase family DNA binding protein